MEFAQVGNIIESCFCFRNRIGLSGTNDLLAATFAHLPESIGGPSVNIARIFLTATNCCASIEDGLEEKQPILIPIVPTDYSRVFLSSSTNGLGYRVILYYSTNITFGAVYKLVQECSDKGIKIVYFANADDMLPSVIESLKRRCRATR